MRILAITNLYPTPRQPTMGTFVEQQIVGLKRIGVEVDVMLVNRAERGMSSYFTMRAALQEHIAQFQPNVVHVMYGGVLAERVTSMVTGMPVLVSFCGSDLLGERLSGVLRRIVSECGVLASHIAARRAVGIIVKSRNLEEALPVSVDRSKVRIIPNGINLERFNPLDQVDCRKKLGWNLNKFHVLFPANAGDPVKRPFLAQAAIEVANRLGLNAEMHPLRGVPHEEVPIWLNASDAVLLTSLHEGSPNIIKEALACDVPVVSVDVGDVYERISGIDGCHIAQPNADDLAAKLHLVRRKGGRIAGREKVQQISLEQTSLKLRSFYLEVLEFC
jgi:teichuronic acid biosynthesis glycosyltransferase TuaC